MKLPLQISFRQMKKSAEIEKLVRRKAAKLEQFSGQLMRCWVVVEPKGKHHMHGNQYDVHINLTVPGAEIAVTREPDQRDAHRDIRAAVRDAFDSAVRMLEDYVRRRRGM